MAAIASTCLSEMDHLLFGMPIHVNKNSLECVKYPCPPVPLDGPIFKERENATM